MSLPIGTRRRLAIGAAVVASLVGVRWFIGQLLRRPANLPGGVRTVSQRFRDVAPRWSHDGKRIAFLRLHDSGHVSLCVAPSDMSRVCRLTIPEVVNPDQPPATGRCGFAAPDAPTWTRDGLCLTFPRGAWFTTRAGDRVPGTSIWGFDFRSGRSEALFVQAARYKGHALTYRSAALRADGRAAAAVGRGPMDHTRIMVAVRGHASQEGAGEMPDDGRDTDWPAWAPSGRRLAYAEGIMRGPHAGRVAVLRIAELGGRDACRVVTVTAKEYARLCPNDVSRRPNTTVQPYITGVAWSHDGTELYFALTPHASDASRYSIWRVPARYGAQPARVSPDDGWGYCAPTGLTTGLVGAVRRRGDDIEAVLLAATAGMQPYSVRRLCPLEADEWDFRKDGGALVTVGPSSEDGRRSALRVRVWGAKTER